MRVHSLTGADLPSLASGVPIINTSIDVDACVSRYLKVREHSDLSKRLQELKALLIDDKLEGKLSPENRRILGFK